ncbi:hypothetical protein J4479_03880 [Candidatus Woesearchaeota archaeon]|nr:hypothetical protein [Candidatus Woesearchaeota archaeon]
MSQEVTQQLEAIREQLRNEIMGVFSDIAVFDSRNKETTLFLNRKEIVVSFLDLRKFDQFREEIGAICLGIPVTLSYFEKACFQLETYWKSFREKLEAELPKQASAVVRHWFARYDQIKDQISALISQVKEKYLIENFEK